MSSIITLRLVLFLGALIITHYEAAQNYLPLSCSEIGWFYTRYDLGDPLAVYPACASVLPNDKLPSANDTYVAVQADYYGSPEQIGASLDINFGMSIWIALLLHAVGVEVYLRLTRAESERLREFSRLRLEQRKKGRSGEEAGSTSDDGVGQGKVEEVVEVRRPNDAPCE